MHLLRKHEKIISNVLGRKPVGETEFRDFNGLVKSLGAWGGDFLLFASNYPTDYVITYLRRKDLKIWFRYQDLVAWPKIKKHDGATHGN